MEFIVEHVVRSSPHGCRKSAPGFTLLEMLVALLIMGIAVALVSAIVRPDDQARLRVEADRLAQLLRLARIQARMTGRTLGWTSGGAGYQFWHVGDDGFWSEIRSDNLLRPRTLPSGMAITGLQIEGIPQRGKMQLEFSPYGLTPAFEINMALGRRRCSVMGSPIGDVQVIQGDAGGAYGATALR